MADTIIKGRDLMLFNNDKSIAYATNHTFTMTANTSDVSSKDHGIYGGTEVTSFSWEIQSENLYTEQAYNDLFDAMLAGASGTKLTVKFGLKSETGDGTVVDGDYPNWTPKATGYYTGDCYITSLTANAPNGENATYSVTLTGVGKIERATQP